MHALVKMERTCIICEVVYVCFFFPGEGWREGTEDNQGLMLMECPYKPAPAHFVRAVSLNFLANQ